MKHLYIIALLVVATALAHGQSKPKIVDTAEMKTGKNAIDTALTFGSITSSTAMQSLPLYNEITYPKIDTITVSTYCVNPETLDVKWFKAQAVTGGFEYPYMTFNNTLFIYEKYLNVPKGYKAIYSIH